MEPTSPIDYFGRLRSDSTMSYEDPNERMREEMVVTVLRPEKGFGMYVRKSQRKPGFKITKVEKGSYAESLGFKEGDLITAVNNERVAKWKRTAFLAALTNDNISSLTVQVLEVQSPSTPSTPTFGVFRRPGSIYLNAGDSDSLTDLMSSA